MKVYTRLGEAATAADRWRDQYPQRDREIYGGRIVGEIQDALRALGPSPTPEAVKAVIGNDWCLLTCNECGRQVDSVIEVGEEPADYESSTARLCGECLLKALKMFDGEGR